MSILRFIFITLIFFDTSESKNNDAINMMISMMTSELKPTSILMPNLCWGTYEMKILINAASNNGIRFASSLAITRFEYNLHELVIFLDGSCPNAAMFLNYANKMEYFKAPYRWLILQGTNQSIQMNHLDILTDSDVVIARRNVNGYKLIEVHKISSDTKLIETTKQYWYDCEIVNIGKMVENENNVRITNNTQHCGILKQIDARSISTKRRDLKGHTLTTVLVITDSNDTRNHLSDRILLNEDSISKMTYAVVNVCFEMLNATERVVFTHTWGYPDKNGHWQGLMDHLLRKDGDLGTLTILTKERMAYIDYIAMTGSTTVRFVFREPPLSSVSNIFTLPFTGGVWLAILICVLGCALFLYITSKWEASVGMQPFQLDGSWADVLILTIGAVLQQGCTIEPRYAAGRCVMLLLFISLTILYAAYSANIVVLLRAPSSSIRTVQDLYNSPLTLAASDLDYNKYFLKNLKDPLRKTIYEKRIAPKGRKPNFYSMTEGVERIRKGLFAFHMEVNPGYRLIQETYQEEEKCDLVAIDFINIFDPWIPAQKRGPYKEFFKISFMRIRESGMQMAIHRRLQVPRPRCSGSVVAFSSVGLTDIFPALLFTLYGFGTAAAVLVLEISYHKLQNVRRSKKV